MNWETEHSTEELRKLRAESAKLELEATKLGAEATKLEAEAGKLEVEIRNIPRCTSLGVVKTGLAAFAAILASLQIANTFGWL